MLGENHYSELINRKRYPILHEINRRKTIISVIGQKLIMMQSHKTDWDISSLNLF